MNNNNIQKKIDSLLFELQKLTNASEDELNEFKEILEISDLSQGNDKETIKNL